MKLGMNNIQSLLAKSSRNGQAAVRALSQKRYKGKLQPTVFMTASTALINFLRRKEDIELDPNNPNIAILYDSDGANNCTIGYGALVHSGPCNGKDITERPYLKGITIEQAEQLFRKRILVAESDVQFFLKGTMLTQFMYDAYVSLLYNVGRTKADPNWMVFKFARNGLYTLAANEFLNINQSQGQVVTGLTNRRKAEVDIFLKGIY